MSEHLLPSIRWIGPLHDAGEAARGSRALLRLLEAGGYPIQICPLTPHRPVAATDPERVWLGSYTSGATAVDLTVQRAPVRLLRPVTRGVGVAWIPRATHDLDRDEAARLSHVHGVVVPDAATAEAVRDCGIDPHRVLLLPEAADAALFHPHATPRRPYAGDAATVLWMDAEPGPRVRHLVDAMGALGGVEAVHLVIVTEGAPEPFASLCAEANAPAGSVTIVGLVPDDRTRAGLMAGCDVIVATGDEPDYGRLAAEGAAIGRPVVGWVAREASPVIQQEHAGIDGGPEPEALRLALHAALAAAGDGAGSARPQAPGADIDALVTFARGLPPLNRRSARLGTTRVRVEGPLFSDDHAGEYARGLVSALSSGWGLEVTAVETDPTRQLPQAAGDEALHSAITEPPSGVPHVTISFGGESGHAACAESAARVDIALCDWPSERDRSGFPADEVWAVGSGLAGVEPPDPGVLATSDPLDPDRWNPAVLPLQVALTPGPLLLYVGGEPDTLHVSIAEAFREARRDRPDATLVLATLDPAAAAPIPQTPVDGLVAIRVPWSRLPGVMAACDWALCPSDRFHAGLAMRALACGLPLIAPHPDEVPRALRPATITAPNSPSSTHEGDRVPEAQPNRPAMANQLEGAIRRALACDAETRRALSTAAARIVRPATWDLTVPVLADRLRMLAATPAGMGTR
ncbi:MAG: glycosyltransferase [Actinobacteria bacterium]|nr:glycosyltransferase [Actinomycetota bacterium]